MTKDLLDRLPIEDNNDYYSIMAKIAEDISFEIKNRNDEINFNHRLMEE